jgi:hypothetical protein
MAKIWNKAMKGGMEQSNKHISIAVNKYKTSQEPLISM